MYPDERVPTIGVDERVLFAIRWAAHGGGSEREIVERFDVSVVAFYRQVLATCEDAVRAGTVSAVVAERVAQTARRRIWLGE